MILYDLFPNYSEHSYRIDCTSWEFFEIRNAISCWRYETKENIKRFQRIEWTPANWILEDRLKWIQYYNQRILDCESWYDAMTETFYAKIDKGSITPIEV